MAHTDNAEVIFTSTKSFGNWVSYKGIDFLNVVSVEATKCTQCEGWTYAIYNSNDIQVAVFFDYKQLKPIFTVLGFMLD